MRSITADNKEQGIKGINSLGHREYVGGLWEKMGLLQFKFLVSNGLKPKHYLLDIACGSLRAGVHFIKYLEPGHYLGLEKEKELVERGIKFELTDKVYQKKSPQFVISENFEFDKFDKSPDYAIAQSLFTHLTPDYINLCLNKLRKTINEEINFYSTFFICDKKKKNPVFSHDHKSFNYTLDEINQFGRQNGWQMEYIGDWDHPRNQKMVLFKSKKKLSL